VKPLLARLDELQLQEKQERLLISGNSLPNETVLKKPRNWLLMRIINESVMHEQRNQYHSHKGIMASIKQ